MIICSGIPKPSTRSNASFPLSLDRISYKPSKLSNIINTNDNDDKNHQKYIEGDDDDKHNIKNTNKNDDSHDVTVLD